MDIDRRIFIKNTAALLVLATPKCLFAQGSTRGCCILPANSDDAYRTLFNNKPQNGEKANWEQHLGTNSGISTNFEAALGDILIDMSTQFSVSPGFGFYPDGDSPNAIAVDKAVVPTTNGMIAFGRTLLRKQLELDPEAHSVAAICAHEFAHIYQYKAGFYNAIERNYPSYIIELHADFLAGAYLQHYESQRHNISLLGVGRAWEEMGSSRFTETSTHGSNAMRLDSIQAGYFWARENPDVHLYDAASAGVEHVSRHA